MALSALHGSSSVMWQRRRWFGTLHSTAVTAQLNKHKTQANDGYLMAVAGLQAGHAK
jgi:hypothetical protein